MSAAQTCCSLSLADALPPKGIAVLSCRISVLISSLMCGCGSSLLLFVLSLLLTEFHEGCELFWSSQQSLGYQQGIQLQVCCNASRVKVWSFGSVKNFSVSRLVYQSVFPRNEDDLHSELQLSMCSDRSEPIIGRVDEKPGVQCTYSNGQFLNIPHGALSIPNWYLICYEVSDGCQMCRILILCNSALTVACSDMYIVGSSPIASNSNIYYWFQTGKRFPFENSSKVELTTRLQRNGELVDRKIIPVSAGEKETLTISGLVANELYDVRRCVVIEVPPLLKNDRRFSFNNSSNRLCTEETYRTLPNTATVSIVSLWITVLTVSSSALG
ncbi:hypothetical protein Angca_001013 [Angiostrongylus cantonensis]|nr:hypothetical protein Angca_001013 [Angiostrongylus cantonensis]